MDLRKISVENKWASEQQKKLFLWKKSFLSDLFYNEFKGGDMEKFPVSKVMLKVS